MSTPAGSVDGIFSSISKRGAEQSNFTRFANAVFAALAAPRLGG